MTSKLRQWQYTFDMTETAVKVAGEDVDDSLLPTPSSTRIPIGTILQSAQSPCQMSARRALVRRFNEQLQDLCEQEPIFKLVDLNPTLTDKDGTVLPSFVCHDPHNIHPMWEPSLQIWVDQLKKVGVITATWAEAWDRATTNR